MKKVLCMILACALLLGIAACGGGAAAPVPAGDNATEASQQQDGPVTLTLLCIEDSVTKAAEAWNEAHPDIYIEIDQVGMNSVEEKIRLAIASGTPYDIVCGQAHDFASIEGVDQYFADLYPYSEALSLENYDESVLSQNCVYNNKLVVLPAGMSYNVMGINMTAAKAYGIDGALKNGMTVSEVFDLAEKLHAENPDIYFFNFSPNRMQEFVVSMLKQMTGNQLISSDTFEMGFTRDELIKALDLVSEGYDRGVWEPIAVNQQNSPTGQNLDNTAWIQSKLICVTNSGGGMLYAFRLLEDKTAESAFFSYPLLDGTSHGACNVILSGAFAVSNRCAAIDKAIEFISFMTNDTAVVDIFGADYSYGGIYNNKKLFTYAVENGLLDGIYVASDEAAMTNPLFSDNAVSQNENILKIFEAALEELGYAKKTSEEAADYIIENVNVYLDQYYRN